MGLTTPTAKLATSQATSVLRSQLALTTPSATRTSPTSVTLRTPLTPPASTVMAGNANQDVSQITTAPVGTHARIIYASIPPEKFSSSRSPSERRLVVPTAPRRV